MKLFLLTLAFVALAVIILLAYALGHNGHVGQHVSANRELRRRGVGCVQSQDREARAKTVPTTRTKKNNT